MPVNILRHKFEAVSVKGKGGLAAAARRYCPLQLGWRLSIHQAQGRTLDRVALYLCSVFILAKVYVAFSRVRELEDIFWLSYDYRPPDTGRCQFCERPHYRQRPRG